MKIAINGIFFQQRAGGIKEYIYNLVSNLYNLDKENEYILYVLKDYVEYAKKEFPSGLRIKVIPYNSKNILSTINRALFENSFWKKEEVVEKFDVFHSPFFYSPKFRKAKIVITVHDMRFMRYPYTYTFLRYTFLKYKVKKSLLSVDCIISISEFTKKEIINAYNIDPDKIKVIHESINTGLFNVDYSLDVETDIKDKFENEKFILTVGHVEPRKNYDRLIDCFENIKKNDNHKDLKLVIIGKKGHHYKNTLDRILTNKDIIYLNFVDHSTLVWFYKHALLFVFPSLYEGFGFPPLEAAALGTISVVSNKSSIPEICNDSVMYFDPYDIKDMENAILKVLQNKDLQNDLKIKSCNNLKRFSWERNAAQTIEIYEKYK